MGGERLRTVPLRAEQAGRDSRFLCAYIDDRGDLHIDGQDVGAGTASVSSDGEYEWFQVIDSIDVLRVVELLDGRAGEDILDLLARRWTGTRSYELEKRLRESDIPIERSTWSG